MLRLQETPEIVVHLMDSGGMLSRFHKMNHNFRSFLQTKHRVVVEVGLGDGSILELDFAMKSSTQPIYDSRLYLLFHNVRVDDDSAINHGIDFVNADGTVDHFNFSNLSAVSVE